MLKASPCNVPLRGLYQIEQPGYIQYAAHLPAFLYATDTQKKVPVTREGYPIMLPPVQMIPLLVPSITISFKGKTIPDQIAHMTGWREVNAKGKGQHTYLLNYTPGLLSRIRASDFESGTFPIANTVAAEDLPSLITILRILSSFLRVHKYPAFENIDDLLFDLDLRHEKRSADVAATDYDSEDFATVKKRVLGIKVDGEQSWVAAEKTMDEVNAKIHYAKPVTDDKLAWGSTDQIPNTDGIVFPYLSDLAAWDKETVCRVIGLHFTRCLGHTTDGCLSALSDLSGAWKRSLHRTSLGDELSHIFRVIEIAIPAQARVFPVFESHNYTGCYLSGAGFSVALRREVFRPATFANNKQDFDSFEGTEAIVKRIVALFPDKDNDQYKKAVSLGASTSMRGLAAYLQCWNIAPAKWDVIRALAAKISYPQEYLRINMENIQLVIGWMMGKTDISKMIPMHSSGLGQSSLAALSLSAFGPSAPSPIVPGAQKLQLTPKAPPKFNKTLVFRTTTLENAISDWNDVGDKGFTYNGPDNLSARYQYVSVKGEQEREKWFTVMHEFHTWCKEVKAKNQDSGVTRLDEDDIGGGASLGTEVDLSGF